MSDHDLWSTETGTDVLTDVFEGTIPGDTDQEKALNAIARLMGVNHRDYMAVTNQIIEGHLREIARLKATILLIRARVDQLYSGLYMPRETLVLAAVFDVSHQAVTALAQQILANDGIEPSNIDAYLQEYNLS